MMITHVSSKKIIADFKIFPEYSENNTWVAEMSYYILNSDIRVNGEPLLGTYEIQITSENNPATATAKFSILELRSQSESKVDSSDIIKPTTKVIQSTSKVVEKSQNSIQKDNSTGDNNTPILIMAVIIIAAVIVIIVIKIRNQSDEESIVNHYDVDNYDAEENDHNERLDWK